MKRLFSPVYVSGAFVLAAVVAFVWFTRFPAAPISANSAEPAAAPVWQLSDLSGNTVKSEHFKGKVVILDFWATWCPPCRAEIPGFIDLHRRYADKGIVIVGVSLDQQGPAIVKPFVEKFGMKYPVVMGDSAIAEAFGGVEALPTTFIIDRAGNIVRTHVGYTDRKTFEDQIKPLL